MRSYHAFVFERCGFDAATGRITLSYALEPKRGTKCTFTETIDLPADAIDRRRVPPAVLDRAIRLLHLLGGVSYFKTCLPPAIEVRTGGLTRAEAAFCTTVYEEGLGEFFYRNDRDPRDVVHFPEPTEDMPEPQNIAVEGERVLVPFGGGKDSVVTAELLREAGVPVTLLRMNAHPAIDRLAKAMGLPLLTVKRTIDPQLLELNAKGALNGHVPITAYMHALAFIVALLTGHRAVAFSDERSANVGSVMFRGKEINHQWSKGLEFERMFQSLIASHITPDLPVFSLLRPWSELMIVRRFAELPQYHGLATSCNGNWKLPALDGKPPVSITHHPSPGSRVAGRGSRVMEEHPTLWCGKCPKCAFVFAMLAAWILAEDVTAIVGNNCFADASLLPTYRELLGIEGIKPLECVGTPEETRAAFLLAHRRGDAATAPAMKMFAADVLPHITDPHALVHEVLSPVPDHAIPPAYSTILPERPPLRLG